MDIRLLDIPTPGLLTPDSSPATIIGLGQGGEVFAQQLEAAANDQGKEDQERRDTIRKSAEQLVAITFIMPMLAQMRDDPFKSDLFHGGQTEDIFGQQMDTILADRIVAKADFSIVDAVYNSIAKRAWLPVDGAKGVDTHA